jgi:hypothetical protein
LRKPKQITDKEEESIREKLWQEVVANPACFESEAIANRMHWFQVQGFKQYTEANKAYWQRRAAYLVDCDKACDCPELDEWHQKLRTQFQQKYNKDIKHG